MAQLMENQKKKRNNLIILVLIFLYSCSNNEHIDTVVSGEGKSKIRNENIACSTKFSTNFTTYNDIQSVDSLLFISYSDTNFVKKVNTFKIKLLNKVVYKPNNINVQIWSFGLIDSLDTEFSYKIIFPNTENVYKLSNLKIGKEQVLIGGESHTICSLKKYKLNNKIYNKIDIHL